MTGMTGRERTAADVLSDHTVPVYTETGRRNWVVAVDYTVSAVTDDEAALIRSYTEYWIRRGVYTDHSIEVMLGDPDGVSEDTVNTLILYRHDHGGWAYRRSNWAQLPWPAPDHDPLSLLEVLDRAENGGPVVNAKWAAWKNEHQIGVP